jgi:hypothetical protein
VTVPLARPREPEVVTSPEFMELKRTLWSLLGDEAELAERQAALA